MLVGIWIALDTTSNNQINSIVNNSPLSSWNWDISLREDINLEDNSLKDRSNNLRGNSPNVNNLTIEITDLIKTLEGETVRRAAVTKEVEVEIDCLPMMDLYMIYKTIVVK